MFSVLVSWIPLILLDCPRSAQALPPSGVTRILDYGLAKVVVLPMVIPNGMIVIVSPNNLKYSKIYASATAEVGLTQLKRPMTMRRRL